MLFIVDTAVLVDTSVLVDISVLVAICICMYSLKVTSSIPDDVIEIFH